MFYEHQLISIHLREREWPDDGQLLMPFLHSQQFEDIWMPDGGRS